MGLVDMTDDVRESSLDASSDTASGVRATRRGLTFAVYIAKRLGLALVTVFGVSVVVFVVTRVVPGNPARVLAGPEAPPSQVHQIALQLGLNKPLWDQYWIFIWHALHGDFGVSALNGEPVLSDVLTHLGPTLELAIASTLVGGSVGIAAAVHAARRPEGLADKVTSITAAAGVATPVYWLGLLLILLFAVNLHWLPAAGNQSWAGIILPTLTVGFYVYAIVSQITRSSMAEALSRPYIQTAIAKGCSENRVLWRHALPNCAIPVITIVGLQFGYLLGGAILTETVFAWPGIGNLLVNSIFSQDLPVVQGAIIFFAILFVVVNLIVDILYVVLDPRIRY